MTKTGSAEIGKTNYGRNPAFLSKSRAVNLCTLLSHPSEKPHYRTVGGTLSVRVDWVELWGSRESFRRVV